MVAPEGSWTVGIYRRQLPLPGTMKVQVNAKMKATDVKVVFQLKFAE